MRLRTGMVLYASQLAQAELSYSFRSGPNPVAFELHRRQDGYNPEFGTCGIGPTCAEACGDGFESCSAREKSFLFCYNPGAGQTCCPGGSGRACDAGYYCATDPNEGETYCCHQELDLAQCASDLGIPTAVVPTTAAPSATKTWSTTTTLTSTTKSKTTRVPLSTTASIPQTLPTSMSSVARPPTTAVTTTLTLSSGANYTTTGAPTTSIVTAAALSNSVLRVWGIGPAVIVWAVVR
ncbi:hypothetical protein V8F33_005006 [Rhypophila sp. PSN 637]